MVRNSTIYEDPQFTRKIIRKFGVSGIPEYFIYVFDKNMNQIAEIFCKNKMPSNSEATKLMRDELKAMEI